MRQRTVAGVLLVPLVAYLAGCSTHKIVPIAPTQLKGPQERIVELTTTDGQLIKFDTWARLDNAVVSGVGSDATPFAIPADQVARVDSAREGAKEKILRIVTRDGKEIQFMPPGATNRDGVISGQAKHSYTIPLDKVQRLWVQRTDAGRTALLTLGLLAATAAIAIAIAAATKESCPFVYSWDGTKFVFDAEPYGGATSRGLERDDYAELQHLRADGGRYRLMVTNEVRETQYTNLMELWVVDHRPGLSLAADEWGGLHTLADVRPPLSAVDREGHDLRPWLEKTDKLIWEPPAVPDAAGSMRGEIVMSFPRPNEARRVKLVANVATGLWGSHMIREMLALRGRELDAWYASIDGDPAAGQALRAWNLREELYALKVEVEEPTGWEVRGALIGGGPFIAENRVLPLDLSAVRGDRVRLRIRPPAGFWALNSFALDYSQDRELTVSKIAPIEARDTRGIDVLQSLKAPDDDYYTMPETGDRGYVVFPAPEPRPGTERTLFLHSRGYYRLHLTGEGEPDRAALKQIAEEPGGAARFAAARFARWQSERHRAE